MIDTDSCRVVDGTVVVECETHLTAAQYETLRTQVEAAFPGKPVALLGPGLHLHIAQHDAIARIEAMLATLLEMLAQDAQDEPQAFDLSGQPIPRERGENEIL